MADVSSKLINAPFKDFILVANDGREIQVHKCVLHGQSKVFEKMFTDFGMIIDARYNIECDYDALVCAVMWMYGISPNKSVNTGLISTANVIFRHNGEIVSTKWHKLYEVADKLIIEGLLDWHSYITCDELYIDRFIALESGKEEPFRVEEANYESIYERMIKYIASQKYDINKEHIVAKLETFSERMIVSWVRHKKRRNSEYDLVWLAMFNDYLCNILCPLINYSHINTPSAVGRCVAEEVDDWIDENIEDPLVFMPPTTYSQMLDMKLGTGRTIANVLKTHSYENIKDCDVGYYMRMRPLHELISKEDYTKLQQSSKKYL